MSTVPSPLAVFATTSNPADDTAIFGLKVAVRGFFRALLKHGPFTTVNFYGQFSSPGSLLERWQSVLELDAAAMDKVRLLPLEFLPEHLGAGEVSVLHRGDPRIEGLVNCRNAAGGPHLAAVTGTTHSLNRADEYASYLQHLLLGSSGREAVVCTSTDAKKVLNTIYDALAEAFPQLAGCTRPDTPVIPLGVEEPVHVMDRQQARSVLSLDDQEVAITYIGRLHSLVKGDLRPTIRTFARVLAKHPRARLFLAGGVADKDKGELEMLLADARGCGCSQAVQLMPNIEEKNKQRLLAASDIFISPVDNFQETFGLSIVEAMMHGLPVIATDWGGYRDLVIHGETGFLVPSRRLPYPESDGFFCMGMGYVPFALTQCVSLDQDSMDQFLENLVVHPELRNTMGARGKERARQFAWPRVISQHMDLWGGMLRRPVVPGHFLNLPQARVFRSYPSHEIDLEMKWALRETQQGDVRLPMPHPWIQQILNKQLLQGILKGIYAQGPSSIAELGALLNVDTNPLRLPLAYLIKHGVLVAAKGSGTPSLGDAPVA